MACSSHQKNLSQAVIVFLARDERAIRREHEIDRPIELGRRPKPVQEAFASLAGNGADFTGLADDANAMVVAVGNVDRSIRRDDKSGRIVEAGLGGLAACETTLARACDRRNRSIRLDAT